MTNLNKTVAVTYNYEGYDIRFMINNSEIYVNAHDMAKPFGQNVHVFLEEPQTKEYINAISTNHRFLDSEIRHCDEPELNTIFDLFNVSCNIVTLYLEDGKTEKYFHDKLAIRYAESLTPDFTSWVEVRIKVLLEHASELMNPMV